MACVGNIKGESFKMEKNEPTMSGKNDKATSQEKSQKKEASKVVRRDTYKALQRLSDLSSDRPFLDQYKSDKTEHRRTPKSIDNREKRNTVPSISFLDSLGAVGLEGQLRSKNTFNKSKYSVDRAWKSVHAVLRGQCLCLHPDQESQKLVVYNTPILMQSSFVDIAYDYTKRPNVFRLMTLTFCEFLFEANSSEEMLQWIKVLQRAAMPVHKSRKKALRSSFKRNKNKRSKSSKASFKHKGALEQVSCSHDMQQLPPPTTPPTTPATPPPLDPYSTSTSVVSTTTTMTDAPTTANTASFNPLHTSTTTLTTPHSPTTTTSTISLHPTITTSATKHLLTPTFIERLRSRSPDARSSNHCSTFQFISPSGKADSKGKSWRTKMLERFKRVHSHPGSAWPPFSFSSSTAHLPTLPASPLSPNHPSPMAGGGGDGGAGAQASIGVPLHLCVSSVSNKNLPLLVETCIEVIEKGGCEGKGIYRVPGNNVSIAALHGEVDKDPQGLSRGHDKWSDTNAVVGLLKLFFRRLPQPLATRELYQEFIEANNVANKAERLVKIKSLLHQLPSHNFETFKVLSAHLHKVSTLQKTNMMDARNLSIVFGPTLLQPPLHLDSMVVMVSDMTAQCQVIQSIITHHSWMFGCIDGDDGENVPGGDDDDAALGDTPITSMQQQLIQKAQLHACGGNNPREKQQPPELVTTTQHQHLTVPSSHAGYIGRDSKNTSLYSLRSVYAGSNVRAIDSDDGVCNEAMLPLLRKSFSKERSSHKAVSCRHKEAAAAAAVASKRSSSKGGCSKGSLKQHENASTRSFRGPVKYIGECFRGRSPEKEHVRGDSSAAATDNSPSVEISLSGDEPPSLVGSATATYPGVEPPIILVQASSFSNEGNNVESNENDNNKNKKDGKNNTNNNNNNSQYSSTDNVDSSCITLSDASTQPSPCRPLGDTFIGAVAEKKGASNGEDGDDEAVKYAMKHQHKASPRPSDSGRMSDEDDFSDTCSLIPPASERLTKKKCRGKGHRSKRPASDAFTQSSSHQCVQAASNKSGNHSSIQASSQPAKHSSTHTTTCSSGFLLPPKMTFKSKRSRSLTRKSKVIVASGGDDESRRNSGSSSNDCQVVGGECLGSGTEWVEGVNAGRQGDGLALEEGETNGEKVCEVDGVDRLKEAPAVEDVISKTLRDVKSSKKHDQLIKKKEASSRFSSKPRSYSIDSVFHPSSLLAEACSIKLRKMKSSASSHINFTYSTQPQKRFRIHKGSYPTSPILNKAVHKLYTLLGSCGRSVETGLDESDGNDGRDGEKLDGKGGLLSGSSVKASTEGRRCFEGGLRAGKSLVESQALLLAEEEGKEGKSKALAYESTV